MKGFILVVLVAVLIAGFFVVSRNGSNNFLRNQNVEENVSVVQSPSDLDKASQNLDNTNLDSMDTDLNQLSSDSNF